VDPDADIRDLLRCDDADALMLIHQRYAGILHAIMLAVLGRSADADDALQNLYITIARHRARLAASEHLVRYLASMARNEALQVMRATQRRRREQPMPSDLVAGHGDPTIAEAGPQISTALMALPAAQREVVLLKIWQSQTFEAIAALLGISPNTAASRYRYAMDKLRNVLGELK